MGISWVVTPVCSQGLGQKVGVEGKTEVAWEPRSRGSGAADVDTAPESFPMTFPQHCLGAAFQADL